MSVRIEQEKVGGGAVRLARPAPHPLALSSVFLITFLGFGGLLGLIALLIPGYLEPGLGYAVMAALVLANLTIAAAIWWRRGFSLAQERSLVYVSEATILIACLTVRDPEGVRLTTAMFILSALFAALFMRPQNTGFVVVTVALATLFVMRRSGDAWPLAAMHTATVLVSAVGPCFVIILLRRQLAGALERSLHQANTDPMTGLVNRRGMYEQAPELVQRAQRTGTRLGLLSVDIDHFKVVNDTYGHTIGDEVIRDVARLIRSCVRSDDVVVRLGGEEIAVLAVLEPRDLITLAERVRRTVVRDCAVTVSIGVAWWAPQAEQPDPWLILDGLADEADTYLYAAKNGGRNRVSYPSLSG